MFWNIYNCNFKAIVWEIFVYVYIISKYMKGAREGWRVSLEHLWGCGCSFTWVSSFCYTQLHRYTLEMILQWWCIYNNIVMDWQGFRDHCDGSISVACAFMYIYIYGLLYVLATWQMKKILRKVAFHCIAWNCLLRLRY